MVGLPPANDASRLQLAEVLDVDVESIQLGQQEPIGYFLNQQVSVHRLDQRVSLHHRPLQRVELQQRQQ